MDNLQKALTLLMEAGFIINWEKSSLILTTNFTFLGMLWDLVEGALSLPQDKLQRLHTQAAFLLSNPAPTCRQVIVIRSAQSELLLLFGRGSSEDGNFSPRGKARPPLDDAAPDLGLSQSHLAADGGGLHHRGPDGRLRPRIRHLVPGQTPQREVGQHRHSDTYQVSSILV
jgi:hypothetical protein